MNDTIYRDLRSRDCRRRSRAFAEIYLTVYPSIRNYVLQNNGAECDAQDIFQDSLMIFIGKMETESFELRVKIKTFVYAIAKNLWLKRLRANRRRNFHLGNATHQIVREPASPSIHPYRQIYIESALRSLCPDCRQVLFLYYYGGMKMREIASLMEYSSEQVAKNKKMKCMRDLRGIIRNMNRVAGELRDGLE